MIVSAFGVEDNRISKADTDTRASGGRLAAGTIAGPWHGLVAGKKGHKLRAAGNELGGGMAGTVAGAGVDAITRGKLKGTATLGGLFAGKYEGTRRAQRKGHFKAETQD